MKLVCIDTGIGWEHARRFAEEGWDVVLHRPALSSSFPILKYVIPGFGFGVRIGDLWTELMRGDVDLVLITDLPTGRLGDYLRKEGIPTFGGGYAERLELDRVWAKRKMREYGIPFPKTYVIRGLNNLKEFLDDMGEGESYAIKIDTFRGDFETQVVSSREEAEQVLAGIDQSFGPYASIVRFVVEHGIPNGILIGGDWFFDGKKFAPTYHFSMELRPNCIGKWVKESVPVLDEMKEKLERILKELGYRGFYSNEVLYTEDGKGYMIDQNVRFPYPLSLGFPRVIKNYCEVIQQCAKGDLGDTDVEVEKPFLGTLVITSNLAQQKWIPLDIKDETAKLGFRDAIKVRDRIYTVPIDGLTGVVVATGNTAEELLENMEDEFDKVDILKKEDQSVEGFRETLEQAKKYGLEFLFK